MQCALRDLVDNVQSPHWQSPTVAIIAPPIPGTLTEAEPVVFVWGGAIDESRTTIPRAQPGVNPMLVPPGESLQSGWKERRYTLSAWIYGVQENNDPNRDTKFPVLIEQICNALRMLAMPIYLTDLETGEQSKLMDMGENISYEYDVDRTFADQRLIRNACRLDVSALEQFQF